MKVCNLSQTPSYGFRKTQGALSFTYLTLAIMKNYALATLALVLTMSLTAQPKIRKEDHFYRRTVVQRIDLNEKINRPLQTARRLAGQQESYSGLVRSLMQALEEGSIPAYSADDYLTPLGFDTICKRIKQMNAIYLEQDDWDEEWDSDWDDTEPFGTLEDTVMMAENDVCDPDYGPFESVVQIVEDWVFDKNRSEMIKQIQYIQIIWTDPGEALPEKSLLVFKYDEIKDVLDEIPWVNRHNDAEDRTLKEALEMRLFHSFVINVSGHGVQSLPEAEQRRLELVAFEHHLWSY